MSSSPNPMMLQTYLQRTLRKQRYSMRQYWPSISPLRSHCSSLGQ